MVTNLNLNIREKVSIPKLESLRYVTFIFNVDRNGAILVVYLILSSGYGIMDNRQNHYLSMIGMYATTDSGYLRLLFSFETTKDYDSDNEYQVEYLKDSYKYYNMLFMECLII